MCEFIDAEVGCCWGWVNGGWGLNNSLTSIFKVKPWLKQQRKKGTLISYEEAPNFSS